jgi:hypothetical protein
MSIMHRSLGVDAGVLSQQSLLHFSGFSQMKMMDRTHVMNIVQKLTCLCWIGQGRERYSRVRFWTLVH